MTFLKLFHVSVISVEILTLEYCVQFQSPYSLKNEIEEKLVEVFQEPK